MNVLIKNKFIKFIKYKKRRKIETELKHFHELKISDNIDQKNISSVAKKVKSGEISTSGSE